MKNPVMYIIANKGLGMSPGKLAAQVAHAAVRSALYADHPIRSWLDQGETKIVLEVRDTEHLLVAERYINERGIKTFLVIDEGRTEIPAHSATALASQIVDKDDEAVRFAFGDFKTYKDPAERREGVVRRSGVYLTYEDGIPRRLDDLSDYAANVGAHKKISWR